MSGAFVRGGGALVPARADLQDRFEEAAPGTGADPPAPAGPQSVDGAAEIASTSRPALSGGRLLAMSAWLIMPTRS
ncbi:hypothetical protein NOZE110980_18210 [Nocardioides zeicaulis]